MSAQPRTGAGNCRTYSFRRNRQSLLPETHPQELFRECSVYCELVSNPEQIQQVLGIAMRKAILERGVAVVVIPGMWH